MMENRMSFSKENPRLQKFRIILKYHIYHKHHKLDENKRLFIHLNVHFIRKSHEVEDLRYNLVLHLLYSYYIVRI